MAQKPNIKKTVINNRQGFNIQNFLNIGPLNVAEERNLSSGNLLRNNISSIFMQDLQEIVKNAANDVKKVANNVVVLVFGNKPVFALKTNNVLNKLVPLSDMPTNQTRQILSSQVPTNLRSIDLENQLNYVTLLRKQILVDRPNFPKREVSTSDILKKISDDKRKLVKTLNFPFKTYFEVSSLIRNLRHPFDTTRNLDYLVVSSTTKNNGLQLEGYVGSRMNYFKNDISISDFGDNSTESALRVKKSEMFLIDTYFLTKQILLDKSRSLLQQDPKSFDGMRYMKLVNQLNVMEKNKFGNEFTSEKVLAFTRRERYEFIKEIVGRLLVFDSKMRMGTPILLKDRDLINVDKLTTVCNPNVIMALQGEDYYQTMKTNSFNTSMATKASGLTSKGFNLPKTLVSIRKIREEQNEKIGKTPGEIFKKTRLNLNDQIDPKKVVENGSAPSLWEDLEQLSPKQNPILNKSLQKQKSEIVIVFSSEPISAGGEASPYERKNEVNGEKFVVSKIKFDNFQLEKLVSGSYECLSNTFGGYQKHGFIEIFNEPDNCKKIMFQNGNNQPHNIYGPAVTYTNPNKTSEYWLNGNKLIDENAWKRQRSILYPEYNITENDFAMHSKTNSNTDNEISLENNEDNKLKKQKW